MCLGLINDLWSFARVMASLHPRPALITVPPRWEPCHVPLSLLTVTRTRYTYLPRTALPMSPRRQWAPSPDGQICGPILTPSGQTEIGGLVFMQHAEKGKGNMTENQTIKRGRDLRLMYWCTRPFREEIMNSNSSNQGPHNNHGRMIWKLRNYIPFHVFGNCLCCVASLR